MLEVRLLLFSGGVDSTCLAKLHSPDLLLTIDYGQVCAEGEVRAASLLAEQLSLRHDCIRVPMRELGVGDLAGTGAIAGADVTETWPFRNQMLITLAAMRHEREGLREIMLGTVSTDAVHADGTAAFLGGINHALRSQNRNLTVTAPAIGITTMELVVSATLTRDLLGWTFSCHRSNVACGQCRGCNKTAELLRVLDGNGC